MHRQLEWLREQPAPDIAYTYIPTNTDLCSSLNGGNLSTTRSRLPRTPHFHYGCVKNSNGKVLTNCREFRRGGVAIFLGSFNWKLLQLQLQLQSESPLRCRSMPTFNLKIPISR